MLAAPSAWMNLDLTSPAIADLTTTVIKMANAWWWAAVLVAAIAGYLSGLVDGQHGARMGAAFLRGVFVKGYLSLYAAAMPLIITTLTKIADPLDPAGAYTQLGQGAANFISAQIAADGGAGVGVLKIVANPGGAVAGALWHGIQGAVVLVVVMFSHVVFVAMGVMAGFLITLYYVLGPMALCAAVIAPGIGYSWIKQLCMFAAWSFISAVVVRLVVAVSLEELLKNSVAGQFGLLIYAIFTGLVSLAVPLLASQIVGGAGAHALQSVERAAGGLLKKGAGAMGSGGASVFAQMAGKTAAKAAKSAATP